MNPALLIVGNSGEEHVGSHLRRAAAELGIAVEFADCRQAAGGPFLAVSVGDFWVIAPDG